MEPLRDPIFDGRGLPEEYLKSEACKGFFIAMICVFFGGFLSIAAFHQALLEKPVLAVLLAIPASVLWCRAWSDLKASAVFYRLLDEK